LARGVGDAVSVKYVSRVPRPPLDGLIDDLYYLEGAPPYARLTLPPMPWTSPSQPLTRASSIRSARLRDFDQA
jgi:hypothetical protein